jgi:hypothetical protein
MPIRFHGEKFRADERVKHHLANRALNAAQTLHLFGFQPQSWHFQILSAEPFDHVVNGSTARAKRRPD